MPRHPWGDEEDPPLNGRPYLEVLAEWRARREARAIEREKQEAEKTREVMTEITSEVLAKLEENPGHDGTENGVHDVEGME